jgi:predicted metal-dependent phosphoesterase TrpH
MDLPFTYNHPFWFEPGEEPNLRVIPELVNLFPVIEYNMHRVKRKNELAIELARKKCKGMIAATDTHSGMIAKIYTLARGDTFREYFKNIASGDALLVASDLTKEDLIQEVNTWIDLIFNPQTMNQEMANFSTGIGYVDKLVRTLASETLRGSPRILRAVERLTYRISDSGLPASIYLRKESSLLPEIEKQMAFLL